VTPELREGILTRDGFRCVRCGGSDLLAVHHRLLRSQQGQDSAANLVLLCRADHELVHSRRVTVGEPEGFIVPSWGDPATVPVATLGGLVLLTDDYGRTPV
jgi:HNH endonuclease